MKTHFILYVKDQRRSTEFYSAVLNMVPQLDVPGMTEFEIGTDCILGLMPEAGIKRLLGSKLPDPSAARGIPRSEVYLIVEDAQQYLSRALRLGAASLSALELRDWGDRAAYCLDADGHVLVFAERK